MTGLATQPVSPICGNDPFPGGTGASFLSQAGGDSPQSGAVAAGYRHAERAILIARVCLAAIFACHEGFEGVTPLFEVGSSNAARGQGRLLDFSFVVRGSLIQVTSNFFHT